MATVEWSDFENDLIVADYFAMLSLELAGQAYNKAEHRRALMQRLARPPGSIEFKHQSISAVLLSLGHPWIEGYKPATNYQASLVGAVVRFLRYHSDWFEVNIPDQEGLDGVKEKPLLWFAPPPTQSNLPPAVDLAKVARLAEKFDVAERDARNRRLGRAGELRVLENERAILRQARRDDLASKVRWTSDEDGDGAGFDIASFEPNGTPRLIEVKTTNGWERTPFHVSRNELRVAEENRDIWHLVRLWNFARNPKAFALSPPLDHHVELMPTSFLASLR